MYCLNVLCTLSSAITNISNESVLRFTISKLLDQVSNFLCFPSIFIMLTQKTSYNNFFLVRYMINSFPGIGGKKMDFIDIVLSFQKLIDSLHL